MTSPFVDNLVDWANNWIDEILVKKNTTRFFDRDITSAVFYQYILRCIGQLKIDIDMKVVGGLLGGGIKDGYYFGNPTYTALILLSTYDFKNKIESFDETFLNLKKSVTARSNVNDAKNIVFGSILFDKLGENDVLMNLVKHCLDQANRNNVRFDDRVFYAWTLWNFRKMVQNDMMSIRDFTEKTLGDFCRILQEEVTDEDTLYLYGHDRRSKVSKITLGLCLDLSIDYNDKKIQSTAIDIHSILQRIDSLGWTDIADMIRKSLQFFDEGKTKETCDNLRMGLMSLLVKTYERVIGELPPLTPGQTPDPNKILKPMVDKTFIQDQQRSIIVNSWSYVSELAHVEKRGGSPPKEDETRYGFQLVLSAIELMVRNLTQ